MRKERKIINTNIRLKRCDEQDRQACEFLQTMESAGKNITVTPEQL